MLWQLPENFRRDDDRLGFALERLPSGRHCLAARIADLRSEADVPAYFNWEGFAVRNGLRLKRLLEG